MRLWKADMKQIQAAGGCSILLTNRKQHMTYRPGQVSVYIVHFYIVLILTLLIIVFVISLLCMLTLLSYCINKQGVHLKVVINMQITF